jgi:hypothetical protein
MLYESRHALPNAETNSFAAAIAMVAGKFRSLAGKTALPKRQEFSCPQRVFGLFTGKFGPTAGSSIWHSASFGHAPKRMYEWVSRQQQTASCKNSCKKKPIEQRLTCGCTLSVATWLTGTSAPAATSSPSVFRSKSSYAKCSRKGVSPEARRQMSVDGLGK